MFLSSRVVLGLMTVALFAGCGASHSDQGRVVSENVLRSSPVALGTNVMSPYGIIADDSILVLVDNVDSGIFTVFHLPEARLLYRWGDRGSGPDEFGIIDGASLSFSDNMISLYDPNRRSMRHMKVGAGTIQPGSQSSLSFTGQTVPLNRVTRMGGDRFVAQHVGPGSPANQFVIIESGRGRLLRTFNDSVGSLLDDVVGKYTMHMTARNNRITAFYSYHNTVTVFDYTGRTIAQIGTGEVSEEASVAAWGNRKVVRQDICGSDEYIFVLGWGATDDEAFDPEYDLRPTLERWDWDGNLLEIYRLDRPIHLCGYSTDLNSIYGYSAFAPDSIFVYQF